MSRSGACHDVATEFTRVSEKVHVLYISGSGRCGSTILSELLGQVPGFACAGEVHQIWDLYTDPNRLCGCRLSLGGCQVWASIMDAACGPGVGEACATMAGLRNKWSRLRKLPVMGVMGKYPFVAAQTEQYRRQLGKLYKAIADVSGCMVVVDSSKSPAYGYLLESVPGVSLYVVHLVRDPRGVAHSWRKLKSDEGWRKNGAESHYLPQGSLLRSSFEWNMVTVAAELLWRAKPQRYLRVRYEDFVERPGPWLEKIVTMVAGSGRALPFVGGLAAQLKTSHTVGGNPSRYHHGTVQLHPDDEWKARMGRTARLAVTALTWPLLQSFGYSLRA
jgi:hypothetical protein